MLVLAGADTARTLRHNALAPELGAGVTLTHPPR